MLNKILIKTSSYLYFKKWAIFLLLLDIVILTLSVYFSFVIKFDFAIPPEYVDIFYSSLLIFPFLKVPFLIYFGAYRFVWKYFSIRDLVRVISAIFLSEIFVIIIFIIVIRQKIPLSIFLIDGVLMTLMLSGVRISKRLFIELFESRKKNEKGIKTLIIGAGNAGEMIIRDIYRNRFSKFYPIGFLDDDPQKIGKFIHGVRVLGKIQELKEIVYKLKVEAVIIAIPSVSFKKLREIYLTAKNCKINIIKIVPRIYHHADLNISLNTLEDVKIEDLIGRQEVRIDLKEVSTFINNKIILITGAGGSIGSEITKQVLQFNPKKLILFDIDETAIHNLSIRFFVKDKTYFVVGDIKDKDRIEEVFKKFNPEIVFHAAAYKHVPIMEANPKEAVKVNIFGVYNLAKASLKFGVKKFILISTDKAVNPVSVMGATKRISEYICNSFNNRGKTEFISVRFGNVLGSRGSVLPLFLEQLKKGGPLTVTHKDIQRYFMTIPEAVSLVLQAAAIAKGGQILILDMGEPIKILSLAEELIKLHGFEPYKDIEIKFIGLRPGEKLSEELLTENERKKATKHDRIFIVEQNENSTLNHINLILKNIQLHLNRYDDRKIKGLLKKLARNL